MPLEGNDYSYNHYEMASLSRSQPSRLVGFFVRTDLALRREVLLEIARYAHEEADWELMPLVPPGHGPKIVVPPRLHGLLAWPDEVWECAPLLAAKVPTVIIGHIWNDSLHSTDRVAFDNREAGQLAAISFLSRGLRSFAGFLDRATGDATQFVYSAERWSGFVEGLEGAGFVEPPCFHGFDGSHDLKAWNRQLPKLSKWLRQLPKPVGIFCDRDRAGEDLLRACKALGLNVPHEVAVVGVGNDPLVCSLAHPPLASVDLRGRHAGRLAAQLLDERMRFPRRKPKHETLGGFWMAERASLDLFAVDDKVIALALKRIKEKATSGLTVSELVAHSGVSRRVFEVRFQKATNRTPHQEIVRVRVEKAQQLLSESSLSMAEVSEKCGFSEPTRLCEVFAREVGITPKDWRKGLRQATR